MRKYLSYKNIFFCVLFITVSVLLYISQTLSISYKEALNVFVNSSVLSYLTNFSIYIFGQNDFALRIPFIVFYTLSVILMYKLTKDYFRYEKDRYISIFMFMALPGVLSASLLVNSAILVIFCTLLYLYYYQKYKKHSYILLGLFLFIDNSFAILYLAIFLYSLKKEDKNILYFSAFLFIVSIFLYGLSTSGKPRGFLIDTFTIYSSIFSPFLFFYFTYSIYRAALRKNEQTLTWYISMTAFLLSIILSFRQKIYIEDFAPFVVVALPFTLKRFFHSYRVRLKEFRKFHKLIAISVLSMLLINVTLTFANRTLYKILENPKKHFAYKYHFAKDISKQLKKYNINNVLLEDKRLMLRLKFYNIKEGYDYLISENEFFNYDRKIVISYFGEDLLNVYVKKLK